MIQPEKLACPANPQLDVLKWRCIGPSRGGRVVAVAGDPVNQQVFYFGAVGGGVWKTTDGGNYWHCVTDGFFSTSAIGAIAVAPSDPNVIYAGTGETAIRLDVSYGDGIYKSTDAGRSWRHSGLDNTRFIGEIRVHPSNPDHLYVAALGDIFGKNADRGVYRSIDGGDNWELILHQNDAAGAVDIAMDPNNPRILFASFWEAHRSFWDLSSGGPGSALFRSTDGGDTWEEVSIRPGFPEGLLGKMGVSVSGAQPGRVFALVETEGKQSGLYRSDNYGDSWLLVCRNRDLMHRPWYYMHIFADPQHADTVYVTNLQMWKSTDGGVDFTEITTPHGDNHDLWIDPNNPLRMIEGNDGGACVSFNGGYSWSSIYNQMTAQFYRLDIDDQFPYRVFATQQDNTSIAVPNGAEWGGIPLSECSYPGTGESGFIAVNPDDNNIVYIGAVGSSPGGNGALQRYDYRTRQIQLINVWPESDLGYADSELRYRFAWTFPIVFSPHDSSILYAGGNHVFRTKDEGASWEEISPDLSRQHLDKMGLSGGPLTGDSAGAERYASCAYVVESAHRRGEIWASTDDGLVHLTRDDGHTWEDVTPPEMPELAYIGCIEISPTNPDVVYVAGTCYKSADYEPYMFRSSDSGNSWKSINGDYPKGEISRVLRVDPVRPGLLYAGSETGAFYTLNDGKNWSRMGGGLPVSPIYDLKIKDADLVAATHGRSFWILDDLTPLREMPEQLDGVKLFTPKPTHRTKMTWSVRLFSGNGIAYGPAFGLAGASEPIINADGEKETRHLDMGENPPGGTLIYYWLPDGIDAPVALTIEDSHGNNIINFASDDDGDGPHPKANAGLNCFLWDFGYPAPTALDPALNPPEYPAFTSGATPGLRVGGPLRAIPGRYKITLTCGEVSQSANFDILKDPRVDASAEDFQAQFELVSRVNTKISELRKMVNNVRRLKLQLKGLPEKLSDDQDHLTEKANAVMAILDALDDRLDNPTRETPRDALRHKAGLEDGLENIVANAGIADRAPTKQVYEITEAVFAEVDAEFAKYQALITGDLAELNTAIADAGIGNISVAVEKN